jgi:hypothetical protein
MFLFLTLRTKREREAAWKGQRNVNCASCPRTSTPVPIESFSFYRKLLKHYLLVDRVQSKGTR